MSVKPTEIKVLVEGGKASPGPPLGPALGPLRVNVKAVIDEINKATKEYSGMTVPVVVKVFPAGKQATFEIEVKTPPTSSLLIKAAGAEKGSGTPNTEYAGNITFEQLISVTKTKRDVMLAKTLKAAAKEALGTALSSGITVDDKPAKQVIQEVNDGEYDEYFK
ncbi:MAG: 50S ribosomal protein L11 [Candidatus Hodarchaeales archaeon]